MKLSLVGLLTLLVISMEVTPLLSVITFGGGNLIQLLVVLFCCLGVLGNTARNVHVPKGPLIILFCIGGAELLGQIAFGYSVAIAARILVISIVITVLLSYKESFFKYCIVFVSFTSLLVVLNTIALILAIISFDSFSHVPTFFSDEAVFRKIDYTGALKVRSIGLINFISGNDVFLKLINKDVMPSGFSAEPHAFFSFILIGLLLKIKNGFRWDFFNIIIIGAYCVSLITTIAFSNLISLLVAIFFSIILTCKSSVLKRSGYMFFLFLGAGVLIYLLPIFNNLANIQIQISSTFNSSLNENLANRSGVETVSAFVRIFKPSMEIGFLTVGPSPLNNFKVNNIFILNLVLYWMFIFYIFLKPCWDLSTNRLALKKAEVILLTYLIVYSFKNTSSTIYLPYIMTTLIMYWYHFGAIQRINSSNMVHE